MKEPSPRLDLEARDFARLAGLTRWARDEIDAVIDRAKTRRSAE
jgi:hypothetical protein